MSVGFSIDAQLRITMRRWTAAAAIPANIGSSQQQIHYTRTQDSTSQSFDLNVCGVGTVESMDPLHCIHGIELHALSGHSCQ